MDTCSYPESRPLTCLAHILFFYFLLLQLELRFFLTTITICTRRKRSSIVSFQRPNSPHHTRNSHISSLLASLPLRKNSVNKLKPLITVLMSAQHFLLADSAKPETLLFGKIKNASVAVLSFYTGIPVDATRKQAFLCFCCSAASDVFVQTFRNFHTKEAVICNVPVA